MKDVPATGLLEDFLTGSSRQRFGMVDDPQSADGLRPLLGDGAVHELQGLARAARRSGRSHLGPGTARNLVLVPGVMGSMLASQGLGGVWWHSYKSRHRIDDLRLTADGRGDANAHADVAAVAVDPEYETFLTAAGKRDDFGCVAFPYDWRKPLDFSADALRDRVGVLRAANGGRPVHLVGHSMGGLVIRTALMRHPGLWKDIGKVVFLGTPHYGSPAIAGYLKNHFWGFDLLVFLRRYLSRETFRSLWGVLGLLPAPAGVYPGTRPGDARPETARGETGGYVHPCGNFDFYNAAEWRLDFSEPREQEALQRVLDAAAAHHRALYSWHASLDQTTQRSRMAVIAGVGYRTLFRTAYVRDFGFSWRRMDRETRRSEGHPHREGDGRVPLASAVLEGMGETRYVNAEHGDLHTVPAVYEDAFRFLAGTPMRLPRTPKGAMQRHLSAGGTVSETPALAGSRAGWNGDPEDPGYLDFGDLTASDAEVLEKKLAAEQLPEFLRVRIL